MDGKRLTDKELSKAMRSAREQGSYSLADFATLLGVRISSISDWETSEHEGEPSRGMKILHYFAALLQANPEVRDRLLREIGALEGSLQPDHELYRLMSSIRAARDFSDWPDRRLLIETALRIGQRESRAAET